MQLVLHCVAENTQMDAQLGWGFAFAFQKNTPP